MQAASQPAPLLVLAIGNPSRGDDAAGPLLAERLQAWLAGQDAHVQAQVEVIVDQQLAVEHAYDLQGRRRVLFVDAAMALPPLEQGVPAVPPPHTGVTLWNMGSTAPIAISSHTCMPAYLMGLSASLFEGPPPEADLLAITGHGFDLGAPLSREVENALPEAWRILRDWLQRWRLPG